MLWNLNLLVSGSCNFRLEGPGTVVPVAITYADLSFVVDRLSAVAHVMKLFESLSRVLSLVNFMLHLFNLCSVF